MVKSKDSEQKGHKKIKKHDDFFDYNDTSKKEVKRAFKDYPAMIFMSDVFIFCAFMSVFFGVISFIYFFDNDNLIPGVYIIISTALSWLSFKFLSELCKILCDITYYLKSINKKIK